VTMTQTMLRDQASRGERSGYAEVFGGIDVDRSVNERRTDRFTGGQVVTYSSVTLAAARADRNSSVSSGLDVSRPDALSLNTGCR